MKNLYLIPLVLSFSFLNAQSGPAGVGNSTTNELWLVVDTHCYSNSGTTKATNNTLTQQWNDISGNNHHASELINANKPLYLSNQINGFSALRFNGTSSRILSTGLSSNSQATVFVVVKINALVNNNDGIIQAGPNGTAFTSNASQKSIGMWINTTNATLWGRGVQSSGTMINVPASTPLTTNQYYIVTQDYNGSSIDQYINGTLNGTTAYNGTLQNWSDFGIGRQATESLDGDIAEIIVYRNHLNEAQRIIVENYLSAKYGLTLSSNDLYQQDNPSRGNFDFELSGIGQINASNIHDEAQGSSIVKILNPTNLNDNEFLIWAHNNDVAQANNTSDIPPTIVARFDRVWRCNEVRTNGTSTNVGNVDIQWDLSNFGTVDASNLSLLVDTDNDGLFADETPIVGAISLGSGIYQFNGVSELTNNRRFTLATNNLTSTPLPIELLSFNAFVNALQQVEINWQTASEINNDYFTIERSLDAVNWSAIAQIEAYGNSNSVINYSYLDKFPLKNTSYYRLKQTDFDGAYSYSKLEVVENTSKSNIAEIYPNPAYNTIIITNKDIAIADINFYSINGENMLPFISISNNYNFIQLNVSHLKQGVYLLKIGDESTKIIKK